MLVDLGKGLNLEFQAGAVVGNVGGAGATASSASAEISFTLVPVEFVWDGKEGFAFGDEGNWSDDIAPGRRNTVQLTSTQAKAIEFQSGVLTENARLIVGSGSETTVDLNGGTWRIDPGTITPDPDGQLQMGGGTLDISDGTLEVFGTARVRTDGATDAQLSLGSGGKLIVRDGDFFTARGVENEAALVFIDGAGSLLEARSIGVGDGSGWLVTRGGQVIANQSINIGGESNPFMNFNGTSNSPDLIAISTLTVADGGSLAVGAFAPGSIFFSDGALGLLGDDTDATVTVGSDVAEGLFKVSGQSIVAGGNFTIGANGELEVTESLVNANRIAAEGGIIDAKAGGEVFLSESLSLFGDAFLSVDGNSLVQSQTLFAASSRIHLTGNSRLLVPGDNALGLIPLDGSRSARMLGGTLLIEAGSVFETPVFALEAGTVLGRGTIRGTVVNTGGSILPGQSPGILTIDGDYLQSGGRIVLEIGGTGAGTQFDQLVVTGAFDLSGGEIEFSFIDGFAPEAGQTFEFFDVGGTFTGASDFVVTGLEDGWEFATAFDPETGTFGLTSLNDGIAVPEPGILGLIVLGVLTLLLLPRLSQLTSLIRSR